MNVTEIYTRMGLALEDVNERAFNKTRKLDAYNEAQDIITNIVDTHYLSELQYLKEAVPVSGGTVAMTTAALDYVVLQGDEGIMSVKVSNGAYADPIPAKEMRRMDNPYLAASKENPKYSLLNQKIWVFPRSISAVDVGFLRPAPTVSGSQDSILNAALERLTIRYAVGLCWEDTNQLTRSSAVFSMVFDVIDEMNAKYREKPEKQTKEK